MPLGLKEAASEASVGIHGNVSGTYVFQRTVLTNNIKRQNGRHNEGG